MFKKASLFDLPLHISFDESFLLLAEGENIRIEKIISNNPAPREITWYDQETDEWVMVLSGEAVLADENENKLTLKAGEYVFLPKHFRHRVVSTTTPCIWLAVHGTFSSCK